MTTRKTSYGESESHLGRLLSSTLTCDLLSGCHPAPRAVNDADALYSFKLLEALRSGEIARIHPFLNDLTKPGADEDAAGSLLAKAIKCATRQSASPILSSLSLSYADLASRCTAVETVEIILLNRSVDPTRAYPRSGGQTPLHLAAELGRADIGTAHGLPSSARLQPSSKLTMLYPLQSLCFSSSLRSMTPLSTLRA